jgi:hypothetical protein
MPRGDLERLYDIPFTTMDGDQVRGSEIVRDPTLLMLVDASRTRPDRAAAEIAWVRERLEASIELVLIWPRTARTQALTMRQLAGSRMFLDRRGEFRQLVSPTGERLAILVVPVLGTLEKVNAESDIFAIRHDSIAVATRRTDHTIDLGDMRH